MQTPSSNFCIFSWLWGRLKFLFFRRRKSRYMWVKIVHNMIARFAFFFKVDIILQIYVSVLNGIVQMILILAEQKQKTLSQNRHMFFSTSVEHIKTCKFTSFYVDNKNLRMNWKFIPKASTLKFVLPPFFVLKRKSNLYKKIWDKPCFQFMSSTCLIFFLHRFIFQKALKKQFWQKPWCSKSNSQTDISCLDLISAVLKKGFYLKMQSKFVCLFKVEKLLLNGFSFFCATLKLKTNVVENFHRAGVTFFGQILVCFFWRSPVFVKK
jgi:hypothetical protein